MREATEGPAVASRRPVAAQPDEVADQPDPVTLSEPTFDDAGLLRWASAKY